MLLNVSCKLERPFLNQLRGATQVEAIPQLMKRTSRIRVIAQFSLLSEFVRH